MKRGLDARGVPFTIDTSLVRGLDYYTRTLFEIKTSLADLGAQNTLCGGGRYDDMVESILIGCGTTLRLKRRRGGPNWV